MKSPFGKGTDIMPRGKVSDYSIYIPRWRETDSGRQTHGKCLNQSHSHQSNIPRLDDWPRSPQSTGSSVVTLQTQREGRSSL